MATNKDFLQFVLDQMSIVDGLSHRSMFGEYGIYANGKLFALVCDNKLFIKPTDGGRAFIGNPVEAPPYPGAKPRFLIEEKLEDRAWLAQLIYITLAELPEPKPKKKRKR